MACKTHFVAVMRKTSLSAQEKAKLLLEWETDKIRIRNDRRDYKFRCLLSVNQPSKYCSMIHDGMCKMRTKLPLNNDHRSKKVEDNDRMFCGLNLAIVHQKDGPHNTTTVGFFSPASFYDTTTNSIISQLMHTLSCLPLVPPTVFIQVDNFPGNKSYLFFGAFGYLLLRQKAIKEFYISFMQPGHTHCDFDARFGNFSTFLNSRECGSPQELISAFKECIPGQALMKQTIYDFKSVLTQYCEKYDDTIDFFNDYGHDYAFANDGKTEKEILFEFRSDGSIQSKAFEVEFVTKNCSCADSLITVPCTGVIQTYLMKSEIYSTDREFYCGNLECNFTIMLNSTCASQFILLSLSSDSNPAENDTFRIFSNGKTICDPYYPCRIPSSNHNIFQAITSSSSLVNARYLTIELSASNISTYLPTFVINEYKPYYFHDPLFTNNRKTPYMILIKLSSELRQRNATIDVFFLNDDYDPYGIENDLGFYQDARLTNQIDFRNCFTAITDGVLKCKTNLKSVVFVLFDIMSLDKSFLFQVTEGDNIIGTEGCVFKNNVFYLNEFEHGEERHFSVMSNGKQKCRIFCYSAGPFIIQHIWISPNSNGTFSIFSGFKEKLLVNIDAKSASLWQNIIAVENIYVMEIPLNSLAMLTGHGNVPFEYPINITNKPYKTVLTTPFYGSSNIISDPDFYFYGFLMFNIFENKLQFTVLDTDFLLPNYFYFVLNKTTYINMTTNSILFGPFATVEIGCSCSSNVNCNIRMLLETINFIEANTTTTLKPSTTTNALTTTNSLKATDQSFSFILTVNYFLLFTIGFI